MSEIKLFYGKMDTVDDVPYLELFVDEKKLFITLNVDDKELIITNNLVTLGKLGYVNLDVRAIAAISDGHTKVSIMKDVIVGLVMRYLYYYKAHQDLPMNWENEGAGNNNFVDFIWKVLRYFEGTDKPTLKFGKFSIEPGEYKVPTIELLYGDKIVGYITPFRGYHFQISETYTGLIALGESYSGAGNISDHYRVDNVEEQRAIYMALICSAIVSYLGNRYGKGKIVAEDLLYDPFDLTIKREREIDKFIDASIDWIKINFPGR